MGAEPIVVGRDEELARLESLLADLGDGRGGALLVRGEAGIGKTILLDALVGWGAGRATVLRTAGVQSETEIAFSGLRDLLAPVADRLPSLPAPQCAALASALALGPPHPGERLAVAVATLGLLTAAAKKRPVLAVVDDVQWLDAPSRECVLYASRRATGRVALVLACRDADGAMPALVGLPEMALPRLGHEPSTKVLTRRAPDLTAPVVDALADAAAGNPLALVELPATLSTDQRRGATDLPAPLAPGVRLQAAYADRIAGLGEPARGALLVAALYPGEDLSTLASACAYAGTDVSMLAAAEAAGLVRLRPATVTFAHPLVRGAVDAAAMPAERRVAHQALADALDGEQRAWHLAAATVGPDEAVASRLEQAAGAASARRGFASAVVALERASQLSPDAGPRARRLLAAGHAAAVAGLPDRSLRLLSEAAAAAVDDIARTRVHHLRGVVMLWNGSVAAAAALLAAEGERAAGREPVLAAAMLADAASAHTAINECYRAQELAERAAVVLDDGGDAPARAHVLAILGWVLTLRGESQRAAPFLLDAEHLAAGLDPLAPGAQWLHLLLRARVPTGALERAVADGLALSARARDAGALAALAGTLVVAAEAAYRLGGWSLVEDATSEAIEVSGDAGLAVWHGYALCIRARLAAARGDDDGCRHDVRAAVEIAHAEGISSGLRFCYGALGFLELGRQRVPEAIAALETAHRMAAESGLEESTIVPWAPDLVEAYARSGRPDDASRVLADLARHAGAGPATARAPLARCRGLLANDFDAAFGEALAADDERPVPFERARTLLAYGRRLHRARRRVAARARLRESLAGFERLGATAWVDQARDELRATGARSGRRACAGLTAQEQRVAAVVANGASNREIAAELFLAPKTVEFHLTRIYRKLDVGTRAQLVALLAGQGSAPP